MCEHAQRTQEACIPSVAGRCLNKGLTAYSIAVISPELIESVVVIMAQRAEWCLHEQVSDALSVQTTHTGRRHLPLSSIAARECLLQKSPKVAVLPKAGLCLLRFV